MSELEQPPEYVWHFKLDSSLEAGGDEALTKMVRQQVAALLRCVQFTSQGRSVSVTGFRFLDDPSREHLIGSPLAEAASSGSE